MTAPDAHDEPTLPLDDGSAPRTPDDLFGLLDGLGIERTTIEHPPLYTVEDASRLRDDLPGARVKNLFLRNKHERMWLVTALHDRPIDLKRLGLALGAGRVSFASERRLGRFLGLPPGAVSPFAAINDVHGHAAVCLDAGILAADRVHLHPLRNWLTTSVGTADLVRFLAAVGHAPLVLGPEAFGDEP